MKSIFQTEKQCYFCRKYGVQEHHIFYGTANRKKSENRGFKVYLCQEHHTGNSGVHFDKELDLQLKKMAQEYYEQEIGSREDFRKEFNKSYL